MYCSRVLKMLRNESDNNDKLGVHEREIGEDIRFDVHKKQLVSGRVVDWWLFGELSVEITNVFYRFLYKKINDMIPIMVHMCAMQIRDADAGLH